MMHASQPLADTMGLAPEHWHPVVLAGLRGWLQQIATQNGRHANAPPLAVFDWDHTCIHGDTGDVAMRWQADRLMLKLPPTGLEAVLQDTAAQAIAIMQEGAPAATPHGGSVEVASVHSTLDLPEFVQALISDIVAAYRKLWPLVERDRRDEARALPEHRDFRSKLCMFHIEIWRMAGAGLAFAEVTRLFAGFTPAELQAAAASLYNFATSEPMGQGTWSSINSGTSGHVHWRHPTGARSHVAIQELWRALRIAGVQTAVVTASFQPVVQGLVSRFGFSLPPRWVLGMRLPVGTDGRYTADPPEQNTYGEGKVAAIRNGLPCEPVLVAGDANTDMAMLTQFDHTQVRLIVDHGRQGPIAELAATGYGGGGARKQGDGASMAVPEPMPNPVTLVQPCWHG